ncbi:MAG TPA: hypothetical protein VG895_04730 [Patescibacteria group bacterium]|nr:hypothetical protein [Patescibacteria group bacterium]
MSYQDEDVKITILWKDKGNLIANANISIETVSFGFITIKGFQIWKSEVQNSRLQESINITPPSKPMYGHYFKIVFLENEKSWFELERRLYGKFLEKRIKIQENEKIDLDEVDADFNNQ